jgi:hypothetical protein
MRRRRRPRARPGGTGGERLCGCPRTRRPACQPCSAGLAAARVADRGERLLGGWRSWELAAVPLEGRMHDAWQQVIGSPCLGVCTHCDPIMCARGGGGAGAGCPTSGGSDLFAAHTGCAGCLDSQAWLRCCADRHAMIGSPCLGVCTHCDPMMLRR